MGFWQHLAESYDKNVAALNEAYPLSTTSISNNSDIIAVIIIDGNGNFIRSSKIEKQSKPTKKSPGNPLVNITIPVTEDSQGRSSNVCPHPVFDQHGYLKGEGKKFDAYIAQLKTYAESESEFATEQIKAIYKYVEKRSIASDLSEMKLKDKTNIIFQVEIPGNRQVKVWKDETFFNAWHQYYLSEKKKRHVERIRAETSLANPRDLSRDEKKKFEEQAKLKDDVSIDYIGGAQGQLIAISHPKKISNASGNAKLVSANDDTNYTFRGKFDKSSEAVAIGYESSQKAHQFLRYLISDRGYYCGEQVILSFTIGTTEKLLPPPIEDNSIWGILQGDQTATQSDMQIVLRAETGFDYADALQQTLAGFGYSNALKRHAKTAVIAMDAATTGRLAITFYRELDRNEYLEKIAEWHNGGKWHQKYWDKKNEKYVPYIGAPSVDKIIEAVHGKPRGGKDDKSYTKTKKTARERLLRCIFDGAFLPKDYVMAAVRRASNPLGISTGGEFDRNARNAFEQVVSTACALVRKDYLQRDKEDYKLSIELDRTDRNYLYGRLLGAADKLEEYALYKKKNDRVVTAAIRHMQAFAQRPFRTWQTIHGCLNPYIQSVKGSFAFSEIEAIMDKFESGEYEKDMPLNGSYLIGFYHERAYINSLVGKAAGNERKTTDNTEMEDCNDK